MLRPVTFKLITTRPTDTQLFYFSDLIDTNLRGWNDDLVKRSFLPCDVEVILDIPLCLSWPADKLIWHYTTNGIFFVCSAYHLIMDNKSNQIGCFRMDDSKFWKSIWGLEVPPRIKTLTWRICKGLLPTCSKLAKRIPSVGMTCAICDASEESDLHILFHYLFAKCMWEASRVDTLFWARPFSL